MASTASTPIGASTSGHVLVQSVSRQTLQLFVGNNRFRCYIDQFGIMGYIRGGFRTMASTASIPIGASTSGHVLVQSVSRQTLQLFVGNNRFRCYIHQFGIMGYIRGGFRTMASTASIPIGASTSGHVLVQSVSRQTLQLFVGNNRFRCYID